MARIRSAKPDFYSDPLMCSLPREIRWTFKGICEAIADDQGRFLFDSRTIKGVVWPLDDDITLKKIGKFCEVLVDKGRFLPYVVDGVRYGVVANWLRHQRISHPTPSRFPAPPFDLSPEDFRSDSGAIPSRGDRIGKEGIGKERSGGENAAPLSESDPETATAAATASAERRGTLPPAALEILNRFYEPALTDAARKRYRDVHTQFLDTLDPMHPGVKIRGGTRVKARSIEHLEETCKAVIADPPGDRDMAIVFVLKRLTNPPRGPTPAEVNKRSEGARVAAEEAYYAARKRAGATWAKDNPDAYEKIREQVDAHFVGQSGAFVSHAREAQLTGRCGDACGFPSFDAWQSEPIHAEQGGTP